jgi:hypothetical protein
VFVVSSIGLSGCELASVIAIGGEAEGEATADTTDEAPPDDLPVLVDLPIDDCEPPTPISCDSSSDDELHAVGLDCIGGIPAAGGFAGTPAAMTVHVGPLGPYAPREGDKFLVLSTGDASQLPLDHDQLAVLGCDEPEFCPSTDFGVGTDELPEPITFEPVGAGVTCVDDPSLIGSGDCSNSLYEQWSACGGGCELRDYGELRIGLTVPEQTYGLAFDFAFMSVEWPVFVGGGFNDMFVAWLESERWTGNVSFDQLGNPITVNAGFTDYTADELDGFAMEGHAGTRWLTTGFGVAPGESVVLILAVFDLTDGSQDSVVLLDGFRWTCSTAPPTTEPIP